MSGGPKGPLSPPQELEVGGRRPPYLLVTHTTVVQSLLLLCNNYSNLSSKRSLPQGNYTKRSVISLVNSNNLQQLITLTKHCKIGINTHKGLGQYSIFWNFDQS